MSETVARIRIELEGTEPLVWRELDLPLSTTLAALHDIIQVVMRWQDSHLHEFVVGEKLYGVPYPDDDVFERKVYQSRGLRLATLIERDLRMFLYVYDFGDNWRHRITIGEVRQGEPETDTPSLSPVPAVLRPRMWAAFPASRSSSRRPWIPTTKNMSAWSNGMGGLSSRTISTNTWSG